ncbi:MAG TPA: hypothetical protein VK457_14440 [Chloroflexota bacterium]|nr:hypothetical protein [Chloroflexota bacterium]
MSAPVVGATAQIVLDGSPYWIVPNTYQHYTPRLRKATPRADGNEAYVDFGLGRRVWTFSILALNDLSNYDGTPTGFSGQQYHDALYASYAKVNSVLVFVDVDNSSHNVRFDHLAARCPDVQTQVAGLGYHMEVELVEA